MSDDLNGFTLDESQRKLNEISDILHQRFGPRWKVVLVLMSLFLFGVVILIVYGIKTQTENMNHLKIFVISILLGVIFFCIWLSIGPYKDTTEYGVLPFPENGTVVPVDSTRCGLTPTLCTKQSDCDTECKDSNGNNSYTCTPIDHPNFYYLGTKLEEGKQFCLPKIDNDFDRVKECGTYTGKIIWINDKNGQHWDCQCLYPDLFNGNTCMTQQACKLADDDTRPPLLTDKDGNQWNPANMPSLLVNTTPYDIKHKFKCQPPDGYYTLDTDPFVSHQNICYAGTNSQSTALFDLKTQKCVCSDPLVQSNITGFCYPTDDTCHPQNGKCRYGVDLSGLLYKKDNRIYLSSMIKNEEVLVDVTNIRFDPTNVIDISDTILKDAFYSFRVVDASLFDHNTITNAINQLLVKDKMIAKLNDVIQQSVNNGGIAQLCDSFFYKREGVEKCDDPLNKSGSIGVLNTLPVCSEDGKGIVHFDISRKKGYYCECNSSDSVKPNEDASKCLPCLSPGTKNGGIQNSDKCCSGQTDQGSKLISCLSNCCYGMVCNPQCQEACYVCA